MWHSATAAAVALLQEPHLLIGGLGGVIAVIVGGVVSVITLRNARRSVAQPAPSPQPAPASRRPAPPIGYGEPAPPTSPARRLYSGPITLQEPPTPQPAQDEPASAESPEPTGSTEPTSLFNPDVFTGASSAAAQPGDQFAGLSFNASSTLRSARSLAAEWRAQAAPLPPAHLTHAPIWNPTPFARPGGAQDASAPLALDAEATIAPPIWRVGYLSERLADAPAELAAPSAEPFTTPPPVWASWLRPASATDEASPPDAFSATDAVESEPPIWSSFLRPD